MTDFARARRNMVDGQLRPNKVTNTTLLAVMGSLPRERFLPEGSRAVAYADDDVALGGGRYLMEPMVLARLIQALQPGPDDRALVVGAGRGYGAGLLAGIVKEVVAVESDTALAGSARQTWKDLAIANASIHVGRMEDGAAQSAPFDIILIEGTVRQVPQTIVDQLAEGGRLATIIAGAGPLGVAELMVKEGGVSSSRPLFEAGTPSLPGFAPAPRFTF